jgi:hypothetical protein
MYDAKVRQKRELERAKRWVLTLVTLWVVAMFFFFVLAVT